MPVWDLQCPACGNRFRSLVLAGAKAPDVWVCSACGSSAVQVHGVDQNDPFTAGRSSGCACGCG